MAYFYGFVLRLLSFKSLPSFIHFDGFRPYARTYAILCANAILRAKASAILRQNLRHFPRQRQRHSASSPSLFPASAPASIDVCLLVGFVCFYEFVVSVFRLIGTKFWAVCLFVCIFSWFRCLRKYDSRPSKRIPVCDFYFKINTWSFF